MDKQKKQVSEQNCADCIHAEVCAGYEVTMPACKDFADKSLYIKLPCKVGDTVYVINSLWVSEYTVKEIGYDAVFYQVYCENEEYAQDCRYFMFFDERIGKTVFLTRELAEEALNEQKGL